MKIAALRLLAAGPEQVVPEFDLGGITHFISSHDGGHGPIGLPERHQLDKAARLLLNLFFELLASVGLRRFTICTADQRECDCNSEQ